MIDYFKKSLIRQLILGVSIVHALLMTIFVGDFVYKHKLDLENKFEESSFEYAKLIASSSIQWVISSDFQALEELITDSSSKDLISIEVIDETGKVLAHTDKVIIGKFLKDKNSLAMLQKTDAHIFHKNKKETTFVVPVRKRNENIGWVRVRKSHDSLFSNTSSIIRDGVLFTLLAIIIGGIFSWLLIKGLTSDLIRIIDFTKKIKQSNTVSKLNLNRNDELEILAENFNDLIETVARDKAELEKSNTYLDLALEGSGLGIWDWNLIDNSVRFDKRWASMLGLDATKIKMELSTWEDRVHPEDLDRCYKDINAYMNGETTRYENIHRMKHADGHWVHILDSGRFSKWDPNGKPIRFTGTHYDITHSKLSYEEKVNEFQQILNASPSCLKITLVDGTLISMNEQGLKMIGAHYFEEVENSNVLDLVTEEHREKFQKHLYEVLDEGAGSLIFQIQSLDGTYRWMESSSAPIELPNKGTAIIAITNDITTKIEQQKELEQQKAISSHQAKLASLGELAAGVGHEINNPLSIIKGYVASLNKSIINNEEVDVSRLKKYTDKISNATDRILHIVQGLRNYARVDQNIVEEFSPFTILKDTYDLIYEIYQSDNIKLNIESTEHSESALIYADKTKLQQVIMNIIANARDALNEHNSDNEKIINLKTHIKSQSLCIEISDNGPGIPSELQEQIFKPYFTTKGVNKGTGIGLHISSNFINEMNGHIELDSNAENGTKFTIYIPMCEKTKQLA